MNADLYLHRNGRADGPHSEAELHRAWVDGLLPARTLSWRVGEVRWTWLGRRWSTPASRAMSRLGLGLAWAAVLVLAVLLYGVGDRLPVAYRGFGATLAMVGSTIALAIAGLVMRSMGMRRQTGRAGVATIAAAHALAVGCIVSGFVLTQRMADDAARGNVGDATMRLSGNGRVLQVEGEIGPRFVGDLRHALDRAPGLHRIVINSPGGLVDDAIEAGELARARGLPVRVERRCASACVLFWSASGLREMTADAHLGLHRTEIAVDMPEAWRRLVLGRSDRRERAVLEQAGFDAALLALRESTAPGDMAWVDGARLLDAGVQARVLDARGAPVDVMTARMLAVIDAVAEDDPAVPLYRAALAHPRLRDAHAEMLHDALTSERADSLAVATEALAREARREGIGFAPAGAVAAWGRHRAAALGAVLARADAKACRGMLFSPALPAGDDGSRHLQALARLIDALPANEPDAARRLGDGTLVRGLAQAAYVDVAVRHRLQGAPTQWPVLAQCAFVQGLYARAARLPGERAAAAVAALDGDTTGAL
ncbi:MAG: hypothetical protein ACOY37_05115 [Pseudomonadota bacterium]